MAAKNDDEDTMSLSGKLENIEKEIDWLHSDNGHLMIMIMEKLEKCHKVTRGRLFCKSLLMTSRRSNHMSNLFNVLKRYVINANLVENKRMIKMKAFQKLINLFVN